VLWTTMIGAKRPVAAHAWCSRCPNCSSHFPMPTCTARLCKVGYFSRCPRPTTAFGNYRDLLERGHLFQRMARYLTYCAARRAIPATGPAMRRKLCRRARNAVFTIGVVDSKPGRHAQAANWRESKTFDNDDVEALGRVLPPIQLGGRPPDSTQKPGQQFKRLVIFDGEHSSLESGSWARSVPPKHKAGRRQASSPPWIRYSRIQCRALSCHAS